MRLAYLVYINKDSLWDADFGFHCIDAAILGVDGSALNYEQAHCYEAADTISEAELALQHCYNPKNYHWDGASGLQVHVIDVHFYVNSDGEGDMDEDTYKSYTLQTWRSDWWRFDAEKDAVVQCR